MAKTHKKLSYERGFFILELKYGELLEDGSNGVTAIGFKDNKYYVVKDGVRYEHSEDEVISFAPDQKLSKVKNGMYAHWFSVYITDDYNRAANMLSEHLAEHPEARLEGFYRKFDGQTFTKYFRLVTDQKAEDLDISYDSGYSPIHYCKTKPSGLVKIIGDVNEWMTSYKKKTA